MAVDFDPIKTKDYYVGSVVVSPCSAPTSCISGDILAQIWSARACKVELLHGQ